MKRLPTMAHVWLEIAGTILNSKEPFICDKADLLLDAELITAEQHAAVYRAVSKERKRQGGGYALWRHITNYSPKERVVRIQFCTKQIRLLARNRRAR